MAKKIAIVTGVSRVSGIGKAICVELAKKGCDIFFTYWLKYDNQMPWGVKQDEPELIKKEIEQIGARCEKLELDLTQSDSIKILYQEVRDTMGKPIILINNATYSTHKCQMKLPMHYLKVQLKC